MKLSTKRTLDHYVGRFSLFCLSWIVRILGGGLRRDHSTLPVEAVVILKFQGMGSLAIARPALERLRRCYPGARLVFWGTPSTCALANALGEFDEVLVLDDRNLLSAGLSVARSLLRIYRIKPDWAIDLEVYSKLSVLLCTLTCARNRAGFAIDSVRLRRMNHTHLVFFNRHHFLGRAYEQLVGLVCREGGEMGEAPIRHDTLDVPTETPVEGNYIVINPNAGELSLLRRWPIERFQQLIQKLLERNPGFQILILGAGLAEAQYCSGLAEHSRVKNLVDRLSVVEMIGCVERASLVISNDSLVLHLGLHSSVPVVGLFGPTHPVTYVDMQRPRTRIHYTGIYCSPCLQYWEPPPCGGLAQCMREIRVEDVVRSAEELLAEDPALDFRLVGTALPQKESQYYAGLVYAKNHH